MPREELNVLAAFAVVAEERSFTRAALRLGVSTSAVSHAISGLEERLGVRLLARTTRNVAPTEAGERLLAQLRPALDDIDAALTEVGRLREKPAGTIRLIAPPLAVAMTVSAKLARFTRSRGVILRMVFADALRLVAVGMGLGTVGLLFASGPIRHMLSGVSVFDVSTLAATAGLLALVVLIATFWPARRAASVDPMQAMRAD